jgi:glycosyltransferase involved in cell wall biosynthesis
VFGDVLTRGARASSGDLVVKMDDDDWYGPEFLLDLLLAREYSGADLVGTTAEMVYLHQVDRTVRRRTVSDSSERFAKFVAGGSMCLPRDLLDSLGGFRPVRRFVDHQLLEAALNAGATVYRGHGLGYLLRRRSEGHTWDPGVGFFLSGDHVASQWPGFSPSRLLEVDLVDRPAGTLESPS